MNIIKEFYALNISMRNFLDLAFKLKFDYNKRYVIKASGIDTHILTIEGPNIDLTANEGTFHLSFSEYYLIDNGERKDITIDQLNFGLLPTVFAYLFDSSENFRMDIYENDEFICTEVLKLDKKKVMADMNAAMAKAQNNLESEDDE